MNEPGDDTAAGRWIEPRLARAFGAVSRHVPSGFARYVRVFHPVEPDLLPELRWSDVARDNGRTMHSLAQWDSIDVGPGHDRDEAAASIPGPPAQGHLAPRALAALTAVLAEHTADPSRCYFGIWDGWGSPQNAAGTTPIGTISLPQRNYDLYAGPLRLATRFGHRPTANWILPQSPSLIWPGDRSWFVATEVDFDSTLIGGSAPLIFDILAITTLESWPVEPDDSVAHDGDVVNR